MKFTPAIGVILALSQTLVSAKPLERRQDDDDRGSYTVEGLGARKQEITSAGGTTQDIGIAMLETENLGTDYDYGDNKDGDAANFGIFKQNWLMLRNAIEQFEGEAADEYDDGAVLNDDLDLDISSRHTSQEFYGYETWVSGHRNGQSGLDNPGTDDIKTYEAAIEWIEEQLESDEAYLTDDTRFWVDVTPI